MEPEMDTQKALRGKMETKPLRVHSLRDSDLGTCGDRPGGCLSLDSLSHPKQKNALWNFQPEIDTGRV